MSRLSLAPGIASALAAAALFGASTPLAKLLLGSVEPWLLAGLLYLGSGLGLAVVAAVRHWFGDRPGEAPLARADWPWLAAVVLCGGVVGPLLLMIGLQVTAASSAALLLNLEGLFTLVIAWVVFGENVDLRIGAGAAAILGGAILLSWQPDGAGGVGWGALPIVGAGLAWAIDNNLSRRLAATDPIQLAMIKGAAAGTVNLALALTMQENLPPVPVIAGALVVGFLGYGVSLVLFLLGLRHLGTARTGAYFALAPFVGAAIAIIGLGESVTLRFVVAAILIGLGLYLHLAERHDHPHHHEPLTHAHRHRHDRHHQHRHDPNDPSAEPHSHQHTHAPLTHLHPHFPDLHHRHPHRHD